MPTVTTAELVDRAKAASDMRDNFVTPTQWMYWASQERQALDLFLARGGWPQQFSTFAYTAAGTANEDCTIDPLTGLMAIVAVHQVESGRYRQIRHTNVVDFPRGSASSGHPVSYRVAWAGDEVVLNFSPNPAAGEVFHVTYLPHPAKLVLDTPVGTQASAVSYPLGWEERIVLGMARRALIKEESDTRSIDQEIGMWDQRIEEACWSRVLAEVPSVRNVDSLQYGWTDRYSLPPYMFWTWL
jgi:hypothetical protein